MMLRYAALLLLLLTACDQKPEETPAPKLILKPANYSDLPGWGADDGKDFIAALRQSCNVFLKKPADQIFKIADHEMPYGIWHDRCADMIILPDDEISQYIENNFDPLAVTNNDIAEGLFTGYYEASLQGSLKPSKTYNIPLYKRPDDLVMVQLGDFREDLKGRRIAGRVVGNNLKPYESRAQITQGQWPHNDQTLLWVHDPVDAFFVQIQGSGLVQMDDGSLMRIGYAGQNGHPYYAIGRSLIKNGAIAKEDMSLQAIRNWLSENPDQADDLMNENKSYVFFRKLEDSPGPIGGQGVPLTPLRSLAIDHTLMPYGAVLWLDADHPNAGDGNKRLQRLMIAQDTGGAIRGPVRGDVFWGHGKDAENNAGPMKSNGRYWILWPKHTANINSH